MSSYQGAPDGPRSPSTPGGYCLTRCLCSGCPQYAEQQQRTEQLRAQERDARLRAEQTRRKQLAKAGDVPTDPRVKDPST